jgi:hypothetical protein
MQDKNCYSNMNIKNKSDLRFSWRWLWKMPSFGIWSNVRSCVSRRFAETYRLHLQGTKTCQRGTSLSRWLQTESPVEKYPAIGGDSLQPPAQAGSSLADFSTMKMEAIYSSETSVHTRSTRRHIPEEAFFIKIFFPVYQCFRFTQRNKSEEEHVECW